MHLNQNLLRADLVNKWRKCRVLAALALRMACMPQHTQWRGARARISFGGVVFARACQTSISRVTHVDFEDVNVLPLVPSPRI